MTITVSISQFRQNVSDYLQKVREGHRVTLRDAKRDEIVASIVPEKRFDPKAFRSAMYKAAGIFTAKNHPEWATRRRVEQWLRKGRLADERTFDVYPRH